MWGYRFVYLFTAIKSWEREGGIGSSIFKVQHRQAHPHACCLPVVLLALLLCGSCGAAFIMLNVQGIKISHIYLVLSLKHHLPMKTAPSSNNRVSPNQYLLYLVLPEIFFWVMRQVYMVPSSILKRVVYAWLEKPAQMSNLSHKSRINKKSLLRNKCLWIKMWCVQHSISSHHPRDEKI